MVRSDFGDVAVSSGQGLIAAAKNKLWTLVEKNKELKAGTAPSRHRVIYRKIYSCGNPQWGYFYRAFQGYKTGRRGSRIVKGTKGPLSAASAQCHWEVEAGRIRKGREQDSQLQGKDIISLLRTLEKRPVCSVFDPSTHCSATDIMRDCGEKLPVPVEALLMHPNSSFHSRPCGWRTEMHACHVDLTDHRLAKRGNERRVLEGGSTKVKCSP